MISDYQFKDWDFGAKFIPVKPTAGNIGKNGRGVIYFLMCVLDAITADESAYVCCKIGLANGGERKMCSVFEGHATSNCGDLKLKHLLMVKKVGVVESWLHDRLREDGYSSLSFVDPVTGLAWNRNVPERYHHFCKMMTGGTEWFICTEKTLKKYLDAAIKRYGDSNSIPVQEDDDYNWIRKTDTRPALIFKWNKDGKPVADGNPHEITPQTLRFAWTYRVLTGHAPTGCCSHEVIHPHTTKRIKKKDISIPVL